jgi:hypothetical protein
MNQPTIRLLLGNPETFDETPLSRTYVHLGCKGRTVVSGWAFAAICNPIAMRRVISTICSACQREDLIDRFVWDDTGESISDYRTRLRSLVPQEFKKRRSLRYCCLVLCTLGGGAVPVWLYGDDAGLGIFAGLIIGFITGLLLRSVIPKPPDIEFRRYK